MDTITTAIIKNNRGRFKKFFKLNLYYFKVAL